MQRNVCNPQNLLFKSGGLEASTLILPQKPTTKQKQQKETKFK